MWMNQTSRSGRRSTRAPACVMEAVERRVLMSGTPEPVGPEFQVNTYTSLNQGTYRDRCIDTDNAGNFVVSWASWDGQDGSGSGIYAQRFDATGGALGGEFRANTTTASDQRWPSVAVDADGDFVIVWEGDVATGPNSSSREIFGQRFNAAGVPQGGEFRVNSTTANHQNAGRVASDDAGNFVVTWGSAGQDPAAGGRKSTSSDGVYAQRYDAAGVKLGGEFRVNTTTADAQRVPSVAMNGTGGFVVAWQSNAQDGSGWGIYGQRFDAAGLRTGAEFQGNTYTAGFQTAPSVGIGAAADVVVAWHSIDQDGSSGGVYAQRFGATGTAQGTEFRVNTHTADNQSSPALTIDTIGGCVVTWSSNLQDGSSNGVYGQRFDAAGTPDGGEFRVNTTTAGAQAHQSVAAQPGGNFVVVWTSVDANGVNQDGSGQGVFAQRFALPTAPPLAAASTFSTVPIVQTFPTDAEEPASVSALILA